MKRKNLVWAMNDGMCVILHVAKCMLGHSTSSVVCKRLVRVCFKEFFPLNLVPSQ